MYVKKAPNYSFKILRLHIKSIVTVLYEADNYKT